MFDVDSKTLIETARRLRDEGTLPTGRKVAGKAAFFIGAADMPIDPPAGWQPNALLGKVKAGAQFVQTQFCMDAGVVRRYVGALEQAGITKQLAILIGVNPLRSAKSAAWMKSHLFGTIIPDAFIERMEKAADPAREGVRICVELIEELSTIPGVAGVHIMAPGNDAAIPEVITRRCKAKSAACTDAAIRKQRSERFLFLNRRKRRADDADQTIAARSATRTAPLNSAASARLDQARAKALACRRLHGWSATFRPLQQHLVFSGVRSFDLPENVDTAAAASTARHISPRWCRAH